MENSPLEPENPNINHTIQNVSNGILELTKEFNIFAYPPNLSIARIHQKAKKIGIPKDDCKDVCPCCGDIIENEKLSIFCSRHELGYFGCAFSLYFEYVIFSFLYFCGFIIVFIYLMVRNFKGDACDKIGECSGFIKNSSSGNYLSSEPDKVLSGLIFLTMVLLIGLITYVRRYHYLTELEIDRGLATPSDYTILVRGIPIGETEESIKEFFDESIPSKHIEIKKIVMAYKIGDYLEYRASLEKYKAKKIISNSDKWDSKIKHLEEKMDSIEEECENSMESRFSGLAFITFNKEIEAEEIYQVFERKKINQIFCPMLPICGFTSFKGSPIIVQKAPEPTDILWENLGFTFNEKMLYRSATFIGVLVVLGASVAIITLLSLVQNNYANEKSIFSRVLSVIMSIIVVVLNNGLLIVIKMFAKLIISLFSLEKHETLTNVHINVAKNIGFTQFINSAIISLIVNYISNGRNIMKGGGMVDDAFFIIVITSILPLVLDIFDPWYLFKIYLRTKASNNLDNCRYTQIELNKFNISYFRLFEGPSFYAAKNYSDILRTSLMCSFFAPILPMAVPFALFKIGLSYWIDKYIFIKRSAKPISLGANISHRILAITMESSLVAFTAGNVIFDQILYDDIYILSLITMIIAIVYYVFPLEKLLLTPFLPTFMTDYTVIDYEKAQYDFPSDYDRCNPVSMAAALEKWIKMIKNGESQGERNSITEGESQNLNKGISNNKTIFKNIANYGDFRQGFNIFTENKSRSQPINMRSIYNSSKNLSKAVNKIFPSSLYNQNREQIDNFETPHQNQNEEVVIENAESQNIGYTYGLQ